MTSLLKRKIYLSLILILYFFAFDVLINVMIYKTFFYSMPIFEISAYFLLAAPIFLFKGNKGIIAYLSTVAFIFYVFVLGNLLMFESTGDIFTLTYFGLVNMGANAVTISYIPWKTILLSILIIGLFVGSIILVFKFVKSEKEETKQINPNIITACMVVVFLLGNSISLGTLENKNSGIEIYNDTDAYGMMYYDTIATKRQSLHKYGLVNYFVSDFRQLTNHETEDDESISNPTSDVIYNDPYTGTCKDYNVIEIMIETGTTFLMNETLTPNLYSLASDGITFSNNYSKNKTNVSEFIGITGVGANQTQVMSGELKNINSIVSKLQNEGYTTSYFHFNSKRFYNRENEMPTLGFENMYFNEEIDPSVQGGIDKWNGSYPLDTDFVSKAKELMVPNQDKPFYTFFTTFATHGPYERKGDEYQKFIDLGYYDRLHNAEDEGKWTNPCDDDPEEIQEQIEYLQCAMIDFDDALGMLIDRVKELGLYENTIFAIYGDHDAYYKGNGMDPLKYYVYDVDDIYEPKQYSTINIISNPTLHKAICEDTGDDTGKSIINTEFTSPYIEVPTLLDVLGVDYDPTLYIGTSVFRTKTKFDNIFYSHEYGIYFTDEFCSMGIDEPKVVNGSKEDFELYNEHLKLMIDKIIYFDNINKQGGFF